MHVQDATRLEIKNFSRSYGTILMLHQRAHEVGVHEGIMEI